MKRPVQKIRFIEPGNLPYRPSIENLYTYDKYLRTPSTGLMTLATIVKGAVDDTLMYSESISKVKWRDVMDADVVFIGIFTFNADRGYAIARRIRKESKALVVMGGLHASMNYEEAARHCDFVMLGEGDESILEFIAALRNGRPLRFPGLAYMEGGGIVHTGERKPPENIDTVPDRGLLYRYRRMAGRNTIWPQVHASRGCPHDCDYCALIRHFGRKVRTRSPANVVEDIRAAIEFHDRRLIPRLSRLLWITDDNFFADREWAKSVLRAIIDSGIRYRFTVQARYEVGFDVEILDLLKRAGFFEVAMGIEFVDDESFAEYHKKCLCEDMIRSIENIRARGLSVRGLFIVGSDHHKKGIGGKIADFVMEHGIKGVLLQSMYFVPGTPVYDRYKEDLIYQDWAKCTGHVVHFPKSISPYDLQMEIIEASERLYSKKRLAEALFRERGLSRILFIGEYFWQKSVRKSLREDLWFLKRLGGVEGDEASKGMEGER